MKSWIFIFPPTTWTGLYVHYCSPSRDVQHAGYSSIGHTLFRLAEFTSRHCQAAAVTVEKENWQAQGLGLKLVMSWAS